MAGSRRRVSGFTLVELLVVIGVITVLIALLFPALSKVWKHAQEVHCAANLRSIGQAMWIYTQQFNAYPGHAATPARFPPILNHEGCVVVWPTRLRVFLGGPGGQGVFNCPSQDAENHWQRNPAVPVSGVLSNRPRATAWHGGYGYEPGELLLTEPYVRSSYGYNAWGPYDTGRRMGHPQMDTVFEQLGLGAYLLEGNYQYREMRCNRVKSPGEMIAIADSGRDWFSLIISAERYPPGTVHRGGANVLFCDGHVVWQHRRELLPAQYQGQNRRRWRNDNQL